jgi:hypothetical protein
MWAQAASGLEIMLCASGSGNQIEQRQLFAF